MNIGKMNQKILLQEHAEFAELKDDIGGFSDTWLPFFKENDTAELGTNTTTIVMVAHGLITGDTIVNTSRGNVIRAVTKVDDDTITVEKVAEQTEGDIIQKRSISKSKIWAKVSPVDSSAFGNGKEYVDDHKRSKVSHKITTRYRTDINSTLRVVLSGNRNLEIVRIINKNERDRELTIYGLEVVA